MPRRVADGIIRKSSMKNVEEKLKELQIELPPAPPPGGLYKPVAVLGKVAYVSGHGPYLPDGTFITGRVGQDLTLEEGQKAARQTGLALLRTIQVNIGLDRVKRLVKTLALVNCVDDFYQQPAVVNGFSELFRDVFGDNGVGARSAMAANTLPGNIPVEIEIILEIE